MTSPTDPKALPRWTNDHRACPDSDLTDCPVYKALSIAWEALAVIQEADAATRDALRIRADETMRRIEELGK